MTAVHNRKELNKICDVSDFITFTLMPREQKEITFK